MKHLTQIAEGRHQELCFMVPSAALLHSVIFINASLRLQTFGYLSELTELIAGLPEPSYWQGTGHFVFSQRSKFQERNSAQIH